MQNLPLQAPPSDANPALLPPERMRVLLERTALFVAEKGSEFEKKVMACGDHNANFNFLSCSNPFHAYYQHKLTEYRAQIQAGTKATDIYPRDEVEAVAQPNVRPQLMRYPKLTVPCPEGMTREDLSDVRLTAQFVARYGKYFLLELMKRKLRDPRFDFTKPDDTRSRFFSGLVAEYCEVVMPPKDLKEKLRENSYAYIETLLQGFFRALKEKGEMTMADWLSIESKYSANKETCSPPDESGFATVYDFVAQQMGSSSIRASVPNVDDGQVTKITVGSLKDKIQIPPNKQELSF